jgi:LysR family transcriptional regulator, glycine cleavage system transcriptional activator
MRKLPPLTSLRAFEAAARHASFRQAADELGVTPTAISHQIRLLEDICGRPLFRRRPRPLALTRAGEQLFPVLRGGFDVFAMAVASITDENPKSSPLRITSPNAFASRWLVPRLPQWRAAHPSIPLEVIGTDVVLDLRAGDADVAIRYARAMPTDCPSVELFRDNYCPVCHPSILRDGAKRASDLLHYPLIHFDWFRHDPDAPTWQRWIALARSIDPDIREPRTGSDLRFREELHAIDAVVAGQGIAICSDVVVGNHLRNGTLIRAHDLHLPGYGFYLTHLPSHPKETLIASFAAWLRCA